VKQIGRYRANEYIVNVFDSIDIDTEINNKIMLKIIVEHMGNILENINDDIILSKDDVDVVVSIE